jgi:HD-like signal output (HDOD) protein
VDYLRKPWLPTDLFAAVARGVDAFEARRGTLAENGGVARAPEPIQVGSPSGTSAVVATTPTGSGPTTSLPGTELAFSLILKRVEAGEILLPAIPSVVSDLRALLQQPDSTLEDVVALIERDQKMTAQLMRLANTLQYSRGVTNPDLRTAVSRVGLKRVQALAETAFANELCPIRDPTLAILQAKIWTYSLARALAMRALAENAPNGRGVGPERAYLVGLFADVGASFLLWALAERTSLPPVPECITFIREHHTAIGNLVLARWGVEREMTMLARLHHSATLPEPRDAYCTLEVVAASLAEQLAPDGDLTSKAARPDNLLRECSLALGVTAITKQSILARLAPELKQVLEVLS